MKRARNTRQKEQSAAKPDFMRANIRWIVFRITRQMAVYIMK